MRKLSGYGPSLIVLGTALLVLFAGPGAVRKLTYEQTRARIVQAGDRLEQTTILEQLNQAYRDIAAFVEPSVVHISAQQLVRDRRGGRRAAQSSGSGWIYDDRGHVVTNYHVIEDAERIEVQLHDGTLREAEVVGSDQFTDIAVIRISPGQLHPALRSDPDDPVDQGDLVFAFGSPFDFRFSMSSGVVSGQGRSVGVIRDQYGRRFGYENFIQVDAAINPGNSGGPLTDFRGRVIGMNTAIATGRRNAGGLEEGQFAGIGLAIPLDMIEPVVTQLIEKQSVDKGYLGVELRDLEPHLAQDLRAIGFPGSGMVVRKVVPGGPADTAGLRPNDIITSVNDEPVESMSQLRSRISSMLPGQEARIKVWRLAENDRAGRSLDLVVTLDRLPTLRVAGMLPADQDRESIEDLGIGRMTTSTRELAEEFKAPYRAGVMLIEIVPSSILSLQAEPGTVIVEVMGRPVTSVDEFIDVLGDYNLLNPVRTVGITPDGEVRDIILRVPVR